MADEEQLRILREGVDAWNGWKRRYTGTRFDLREANLKGADLHEAHLRGADLSTAHLDGVDLSGADLRGASLSEADFSGAMVGWTVFGAVDLSGVKRLESVEHHGPSTIGIDTIYRAQGQIPEVFLRGAGVPDEFITFMRSLVGRAQAARAD